MVIRIFIIIFAKEIEVCIIGSLRLNANNYYKKDVPNGTSFHLLYSGSNPI